MPSRRGVHSRPGPEPVHRAPDVRPGRCSKVPTVHLVPRPRSFDTADVDALLHRNDSIATHAELAALGVPRGTTTRWAASGPWQRVLPGVIAGHRGLLSLHQRRRSALAYVGAGAVISGEHALDLHGITGNRIAVPEAILVLLPWERKRLSTGFVTVERTERLPRPVLRRGLPVAPPARAAADAARHGGAGVDHIRELFGATLHQGRCTVPELHDEVHHGPRQRTAGARRVLLEVAGGVRSAAEGKAHEIVSRSHLPRPRWNEEVVVGGVFVGVADAYWPELGVALEIDGTRWHSTPVDLRRTQAKQRRYASVGLLLVSIAPADLVADPEAFLRLLASTLAAARRVGPPGAAR